METERIALSQRERDRLRVLHEVKQKHLLQVAAAARLKVSDRQVRRMLLRIRERGDAALIPGLRGRPSNRGLAARLELNILRRVRQRYADFGPTLAAEHLAQEGLPVSRETLRKPKYHVPAKHPWRKPWNRTSFLLCVDTKTPHMKTPHKPAIVLAVRIRIIRPRVRNLRSYTSAASRGKEKPAKQCFAGE
jgi:transposase